MPFTDGYFIMDNSYYINSDFHIPSYSELRAPPDHIHPNSAAAQLGLTPEELAPVLREQQYEYECAQPPTQPTTCHNHYAQAKPPQPSSNPTPYVHPQSVAAQLGLTPNELIALEEECIREQTEWLAIEDETPTSIMLHPPLPLSDSTHEVMEECDEHIATAVDDAFDANGANTEPERENAIERLARKLVVSDDAMGSWAEEMEMGLELQGEYTPANYSPSPSPTSLAPQHQPPPITIYLPPPINYAPPPTRHRPPRTHNTSRRPPFRPYTRPQRVQRPPCEN
jgi:hypothetical protein